MRQVMDMRQDRNWMYNRFKPGRKGLTSEKFISFAKKSADLSNKQLGIVEVCHTREYSRYDPFIFAQNAIQVFFRGDVETVIPLKRYGPGRLHRSFEDHIKDLQSKASDEQNAANETQSSKRQAEIKLRDLESNLISVKSKHEFIPPNHVLARKNFEKRAASLLKNLLAKAHTNSLGSLPTPMELFERTHKHKDESWVDKKSEHFSAEFNHTKEEATQKAAEDGSSARDGIDLWCDIAGVKKGRVYGFGIEPTIIDKRSSCHDSSSQWLQRSEHEELVNDLEEENRCLKTRLENAEHAIEENNKLVQEMMKMMKFQVANPQVGGDGGKAHEE
ncbi:hypothetical protein PIB30_054937 [Stylosanthes scabra]|uniref:Uncharacterized protein n=1 Tax=Stylosanthes scabra TaxID=79078 RepID=A0ABU6YKS5_9FABA|nr:hypothetical protein [Stylosanthes scabra]